MDISEFAVGPEGIDVLSAFQTTQFFKKHEHLSKDTCNELAAEMIGCPVSATPVQGVGSYTVAAVTSDESPKVIQFRHLALDLELYAKATQTYPGFVPQCEAKGTVADVYIYEMGLVTGEAFSRARRHLLRIDQEACLCQIVTDLSR